MTVFFHAPKTLTFMKFKYSTFNTSGKDLGYSKVESPKLWPSHNYNASEMAWIELVLKDWFNERIKFLNFVKNFGIDIFYFWFFK